MVALVTGGSGGTGLAIAQGLHADGHRVALLARDPDRLRRAATALSEDTLWRAVDMADADAVHVAVDDLVGQLGDIDVLVTAAGYGVHFTTEVAFDEAIEAWDREVGVNLRGAFATVQAAAPHL